MTAFIARISSLDANGTLHRRKHFATSFEGIAEALGENESVERIWTNERFTVPYSFVGAAAASEGDENWGVRYLNPQLFWNLGCRGEGIKVGIADSGIDLQHKALQNTQIKGFAEFDLATGNIITTTPFDGGWHGTHCSAILAGEGSAQVLRGIAPNVSLYVAKVLEDWEGSFLSVGRALEWFKESGCDVISLSIGNPGTHEVWLDEITDLINSGAVVIAASGNEFGQTYPTRSPGNYGLSGLISVGAHGSNDQIWHRSGGGVVKWREDSYFGERFVNVPDIAAPGAAIVSAAPNGEYRLESGTSMATPHVAGMVALSLQLLRNGGQSIRPGELHKLIVESALDKGDLGYDIRFGSGTLSGNKLLSKLQSLLV